jgi:peroxiredoxin
VLESQKELFKERNTQLVAVNIDQEKFMTGVEGYMNQAGFTFRIVINENARVSRDIDLDELYSVVGRTPVSYLINTEGNIVDAHWGPVGPTELAATLDKLAAN